ncbi:phosphatase PAP2 family protein [Lutibacter sp. A80]|uniref:phosphatase PAP2 family protein n=1 Tax=Lutibacter sp. A80 TaxID=2918453 RepID=UPI001F066BAA|nr:phosphatase PAP2 family protein [Lutibacter sp. A80]UMB59670.1 phosphatase PAP2 family protein [Lutibacter sp. A80]
MEFLGSLIEYDKQLLLFLHSKGIEFWDGFWLFVTYPPHWIPLFFLLFYLGYKAFGLKKALYILILTALSAGTSLVIVNIIKNIFQRLRPINDVSINKSIRILVEANDFSFVSGHSAVSFTIAFFSFWVLKKQYKGVLLIFIFPLFFAYSRLYLALHYPIDIFVGMLLGLFIAIVFYKLARLLVLKS